MKADGDLDGGKITHSYKLLLADLIDLKIPSNENEVLSDMLLIADDFIAWAQEQEGFEFNKSVNIQKFSNDANDRTAGIVFRFSLATILSHNACAIPIK